MIGILIYFSLALSEMTKTICKAVNNFGTFPFNLAYSQKFKSILFLGTYLFYALRYLDFVLFLGLDFKLAMMT